MGTPACSQAQVANSAHHCSQGPYGLHQAPCELLGSGWICDATAAAIAADWGNIGSGVGVEKLYCQACGSSNQYPVPWLLPMMAEICVAVGSSESPPEAWASPNGSPTPLAVASR